MNYEVQQAISKKVDDWKFHALEQTVDRQKYDIQDLGRKIGELEAKNRSYYDIITKIIDFLESEIKDDFGAINHIRQYL